MADQDKSQDQDSDYVTPTYGKESKDSPKELTRDFAQESWEALLAASERLHLPHKHKNL